MPSSRRTIFTASAFILIAVIGLVSGSLILLFDSVDMGSKSDSVGEFSLDDDRMGNGNEDDPPPEDDDHPDLSENDDTDAGDDGLYDPDRMNGSLGQDPVETDDERTSGDEKDDYLGSKDPGEDGYDDIEGSDDKLPLIFVPIVVITVISVLAVLALTGRIYMDSGQQSNMVRSDLLDLITINPGINLSSIRRELQLSQGAVSYHLRRLEKMGHILSDKGTKERRYYPSSMGYRNAMDKSLIDEAMAVISNESARQIVELIKNGPRTQSEIVRSTGLSPSTVHWHMERLERVDIIEKEPAGRSVIYHLKDLPVDT